jgi:hypothetical protein
MQKLLGLSCLGLGVYLLFNGHLFWGVVLFILGSAAANGADQGAWFSFDSDSDGGDGGD